MIKSKLSGDPHYLREALREIFGLTDAEIDEEIRKRKGLKNDRR